MRAGRISDLACLVLADFLGQLGKTIVDKLSVYLLHAQAPDPHTFGQQDRIIGLKLAGHM